MDKPGSRAHDRTRYLTLAALFAALTTVGAYIKIPLPLGVPITLQTFFVLFSGFLLGPQFGPLSQALYVFIGLIGFPVFAEGGGPSYIFKPTFGYLVGYPLGSFVVAILVYGKNIAPDFLATRLHLGTVSKTRLVLAGLAGQLVIFVPGVTYLYLVTNFMLNTPVAFKEVMMAGFLIFVPGDIVKITVIIFLLSLIAIREPGYIDQR